jgi:hypothetical protein
VTAEPVSVEAAPAPAGKVPPVWAHCVVPEPRADEYPHRDSEGVDELPEQLAGYHAARAYGFWLGSKDGDWPEGIRHLLYEYQLATVWFWLTLTGSSAVDIAHDLVSDLAAPHVIGANILTLLEQARIDPDLIKAYGPSNWKEQTQ